MTIQESLDIMLKSRKFRILGYVTQAGGVENIDCSLLQDGENYTHLVRRALGVATRMHTEPVPKGFDAEVWTLALREQEDSWLKHINENPMRLGDNNRPDFLHYEPLNPQDIEEGISVTDLLCERTTLNGVTKSPVSPKAIAKAYIREQTEVSRFTSKLILSCGKFQGVEMLEARR